MYKGEIQQLKSWTNITFSEPPQKRPGDRLPKLLFLESSELSTATMMLSPQNNCENISTSDFTLRSSVDILSEEIH